MIEIKDIKLSKKAYQINYDDLNANIFDDGRFFCAGSSDGQYCCTGIIVDWAKNIDYNNPVLKVNRIFKNVNR